MRLDCQHLQNINRRTISLVAGCWTEVMVSVSIPGFPRTGMWDMLVPPWMKEASVAAVSIMNWNHEWLASDVMQQKLAGEASVMVAGLVGWNWRERRVRSEASKLSAMDAWGAIHPGVWMRRVYCAALSDLMVSLSKPGSSRQIYYTHTNQLMWSEVSRSIVIAGEMSSIVPFLGVYWLGSTLSLLTVFLSVPLLSVNWGRYYKYCIIRNLKKKLMASVRLFVRSFVTII